MNSNSLFSSLLKGALGLVGIGIASLIPNPQKAIAAWGGHPTCPAEGNSNAMTAVCLATPEIMEIKFYELGFCTSSSLAGNNFSRATCEKAWESSAGEIVDLATFASKGLSTGTTYKVPNGTYSHGYAVVSNLMGLKGRVYFNDKTYYTTSNSTASDNVNNFTKANFDLAGLAGGNGCWDSPSTTTAGYGTTKAYLTNDSLVTATDNNSCDAATRMVGDVQLATPITITSEVQSYGLTWQITDIGLWVTYPGNGNAPSEFGMGPFLPKFGIE